MRKKVLTLIILFIPITLSPNEDKSKKINYSVGPGILWQKSIYKGMDDIFLPFPVINFSYRDRLIFNGLAGAWKVYSSKKSEYLLGFGIRFSGFDPDKSDYLKGMRKRKTQFNLSNSYEHNFAIFYMGAKISFDINNLNNGYETEVFLGKRFIYKKSIFNFRIKAIYENSERANLKYGVYENEVLSSRPYYKPDGAISFGTDLFFTHSLNNNSKFIFIMLSYKKLGDKIIKSPIINSNNEIFSSVGVMFKL